MDSESSETVKMPEMRTAPLISAREIIPIKDSRFIAYAKLFIIGTFLFFYAIIVFAPSIIYLNLGQYLIYADMGTFARIIGFIVLVLFVLIAIPLQVFWYEKTKNLINYIEWDEKYFQELFEKVVGG